MPTIAGITLQVRQSLRSPLRRRNRSPNMPAKLAPDQLKIHSLIGRWFGTLLVKTLLPGRKCRVYCEACGKFKIRDKRNLYRLKSCGCLRSELIGKGHTKHGGKTSAGPTTEYVCWSNIKNRCYNERREDFPLYGGRGIRVCPQWRKSFVQFLKDMGPKPDPAFSIERREVNGPYSPKNCYWADSHTQRINQRRMLKAAA